jgi:hypothetical protein
LQVCPWKLGATIALLIFKTLDQGVNELTLNHGLVAHEKERSVTFRVDGPEACDAEVTLTPIGGIICKPI